MDSGSARNAANTARAASKNNSTMLYAGVAGAAIVGYLWYKRRSDVDNLGDAVRVDRP